jgi:hypothetical protein
MFRRYADGPPVSVKPLTEMPDVHDTLMRETATPVTGTGNATFKPRNGRFVASADEPVGTTCVTTADGATYCSTSAPFAGTYRDEIVGDVGLSDTTTVDVSTGGCSRICTECVRLGAPVTFTIVSDAVSDPALTTKSLADTPVTADVNCADTTNTFEYTTLPLPPSANVSDASGGTYSSTNTDEPAFAGDTAPDRSRICIVHTTSANSHHNNDGNCATAASTSVPGQ